MDVLIVEDDDAVAESVIDVLTDAAFQVRRVSSGEDALSAFTSEVADCVLLDLGLPDIDGTEVCRRLRVLSNVPIIVLSARSTELDRVLALELGADDYLVKPFGMRELIARIHAVRRRMDSVAPAVEQTRSLGAITLDSRAQRVTVDGETIHFTPKEFAILAYLTEDPGAVFRRTDIIRDVWDTNWVGGSKSLDAHIAAIRKKLGSAEWIESVHGVGFRFVTAR